MEHPCKTDTFTKFLPKMRESEFSGISTVCGMPWHHEINKFCQMNDVFHNFECFHENFFKTQIREHYP